MKSLSLLIASTIILFANCSGNNSNSDNINASEASAATDNYTKQEPARQTDDESTEIVLSTGSKSTEIVLSNCKTLYNDNLIASNWVTIANSTDKSIKGIEFLASEERDSFKYKINLAPHSSKRLKTNKFDCNSVTSGIIYSNGEYQGGYGKGWK